MKYTCTYRTVLNLTVTLDADDEDAAESKSWQAAQAYCRTLAGDHNTVRAEADMDGIGADTIEEDTP